LINRPLAEWRPIIQAPESFHRRNQGMPSHDGTAVMYDLATKTPKTMI
jgi:hypothetical protein